MSKNTNFFGQSVFGQLISYIDNYIIFKNAQNHKANHYTKRFMAKDHLISMLFCVFAKCSSLREVSGAMLGLSGKTKHFQLLIRQAKRLKSMLNIQRIVKSKSINLKMIKRN